MIKSVYLYKVRVFDIVNALNKIQENKIKIYQLKKVEEYTFTFYASIYTKKKLMSIFSHIEIIKQTGYASIFLSLLKYKTTLIAMIISVFFYFSLSSKIWKINISGDTLSLESFIKNELLNHNIYVGAKKVSTNDLSTIQNKILYDNYDIIEYLSIEEDGSAIQVNFKKKRKENDKTEFKGSLYACKDGVIKSFDVLSGEKVVKINDYVKKGDLLVKDVLTTDYNEEIYIGTYGSVYAYTWYYVTIEQKITSLDSEETLFANLMLETKRQISLNFTENEYIYEENVLQFKVDNDNVYMKLHFTCVENIAKE